MPASRALKDLMRKQNPALPPGSDAHDWKNAGAGKDPKVKTGKRDVEGKKDTPAHERGESKREKMAEGEY